MTRSEVPPPSGDTGAIVPPLVAQHVEMMMCPVCTGAMRLSSDWTALRCSNCGRAFTSEGSIPRLFWPTDGDSATDVTAIVQSFYEETPFPNYDDVDSPERLRAKAEAGVFARLLDEQIPHGSRILEVGCGTGQLSNFLALKWGRTVFGADMCLNSLKLGQAFRERHDISGVAFVQSNLFSPVFKPEGFDLIIANGVLHHTSDPFRAFRTILKCLKRGGFIIVGLYNAYGRLTTDLRRWIFRATGDRFTSLDPRLRLSCLGNARRRAWFMDQYKHPHESKHTIREVLQWFDRSGVEFVNGIPKCTVADRFSPTERLFATNPRGTAFDHFLVQSSLLLRGGREGGFFLMIGRKS